MKLFHIRKPAKPWFGAAKKTYCGAEPPREPEAFERITRPARPRRARPSVQEPPINETWEYLPGRFVVRGERLRVRGGPVYVDRTGATHRIGERGVFTFCYASIDGTGAPYIVVSGESGSSVVLLLVVKRSKLGVRGWKNKPYTFSKLREATPSRKRKRIRAIR